MSQKSTDTFLQSDSRKNEIIALLCSSLSGGTVSAWIVTIFQPDVLEPSTWTVRDRERNSSKLKRIIINQIFSSIYMAPFMACVQQLDRRTTPLSVSVWVSEANSTNAQALCRSPLSPPPPKKDITPGFFFFKPTKIAVFKNKPWRRYFLVGFKRFERLKYSPSTRFLPSPTAQSEAGLSVLGGTKMATQRLGWIKLPSRTPPRLRRQSSFKSSRKTNCYFYFYLFKGTSLRGILSSAGRP